jgi:integrase
MAVPKKLAPGINVVHVDGCTAKGRDKEGICTCNPSAQVRIYDKRLGRYRETRNFPSTGDFSNFKLAEEWKREQSGKVKRGELATEKAPTYHEGRIWLIEGMKDETILKRGEKPYKPVMARDYEAALARFGPDYDPYFLDEITRRDWKDAVARLRAEGLSPSRIRNIMNAVRVLYREAIEAEMVTANPITGLRLPAVEGQREDAGDWKTVRAYIEALPTLKLQALYATAALLGPRRGELRDLPPENVSKDAIKILSSWDDHAGSVAPKSAAGVRTAPVCSTLWDNWLGPYMETLGDDHRFVFGTATEPFNDGKVRRAAAAAWKAAGLEPKTLHQFRHSFRSFLNAARVPKYNCDVYMGHADGSMGARYTHLHPEDLANDALALDVYLAGIEQGNVIELRKAVA